MPGTREHRAAGVPLLLEAVLLVHHGPDERGGHDRLGGVEASEWTAARTPGPLPDSAASGDSPRSCTRAAASPTPLRRALLPESQSNGFGGSSSRLRRPPVRSRGLPTPNNYLSDSTACVRGGSPPPAVVSVARRRGGGLRPANPMRCGCCFRPHSRKKPRPCSRGLLSRRDGAGSPRRRKKAAKGLPKELFGVHGRYASALFLSAQSSKNLDKVEKELNVSFF